MPSKAACRSARRVSSAWTSPAAATRMRCPPPAILDCIPVSPPSIPGHPRLMGEGEAHPDQLTDTMMRVAATLRDAEIPYLLAGSFAAWARGAPAHHTDLDFVVKPGDADRALEALEGAGM